MSPTLPNCWELHLVSNASNIIPEYSLFVLLSEPRLNVPLTTLLCALSSLYLFQMSTVATQMCSGLDNSRIIIPWIEVRGMMLRSFLMGNISSLYSCRLRVPMNVRRAIERLERRGARCPFSITNTFNFITVARKGINSPFSLISLR